MQLIVHHVKDQLKKVRGQRTEGRGQGSEGRGQGAEGRGQGPEGRGQRAEGRGQGTGGRGQRAGDRGQRAGDRGQRAGVRGQRYSKACQESYSCDVFFLLSPISVASTLGEDELCSDEYGPLHVMVCCLVVGQSCLRTNPMETSCQSLFISCHQQENHK